MPAENCSIVDLKCHGANAAASLVGDAADNLAAKVMEAAAQVVASLGTLWVNVGTPNLTGTGGASTVTGAAAGFGGLTTVLGYVTWIALAVAVISLTVLGALVATRIRTGEGIASLGKVGLILVGVVLVGGAGSLVSAVLPRRPAGAGAVAFLQSSLWQYMLLAAALSVVVGAVRMFWENRAEPGRELLRSLLTLVVVSGAGVTVVAILVGAADSFSVWVLDNALACNVADGGACFEQNIATLLAFTNNATGQTPGVPPLGAILLIVFGLVALLASVVQIVLMVARSGMLVILTGILPLAAAATNTEMGKTWFRKCVAWLIAFILYKPAAAIVYATAFQLTGTDVFTDDGSGILAVVTGLMLMVLALVAMPALMRFVTPMVSALSAGAGGAAVAAGSAAAALPTGAAALGRLGGGGGSSTNQVSSSTSAHTQTSSTTNPTGATTTGMTTPPAGGPSGQAASAGAGPPATGAGGAGAAAGGGASGAVAAAGPTGAAIAAGVQGAQAAKAAAQNTAEQATGDGPSGSN